MTGTEEDNRTLRNHKQARLKERQRRKEELKKLSPKDNVQSGKKGGGSHMGLRQTSLDVPLKKSRFSKRSSRRKAKIVEKTFPSATNRQQRRVSSSRHSLWVIMQRGTRGCLPDGRFKGQGKPYKVGAADGYMI